MSKGLTTGFGWGFSIIGSSITPLSCGCTLLFIGAYCELIGSTTPLFGSTTGTYCPGIPAWLGICGVSTGFTGSTLPTFSWTGVFCIGWLGVETTPFAFGTCVYLTCWGGFTNPLIGSVGRAWEYCAAFPWPTEYCVFCFGATGSTFTIGGSWTGGYCTCCIGFIPPFTIGFTTLFGIASVWLTGCTFGIDVVWTGSGGVTELIIGPTSTELSIFSFGIKSSTTGWLLDSSLASSGTIPGMKLVESS